MSIDTAVEGLAFMLASKMKLSVIATGTELAVLKAEIKQLQKERRILYGAGSKADFDSVIEKVINVYSPIIKNATTGSSSAKHLSAA